MLLCSQNSSLRLSLPRRIFIFILGFTDSILFGGAVFGWPQLVYLLKKDGIYSDLCNIDETNNFNQTYIINGVKNDSLESRNSFSEKIERCGFGNLNSSLLHQKELQESALTQCQEQDQRFALIYTIAVLCFGLPGIVIGFLLHYVGLRITRMLGGLMVAASFVCLALTTQESPNWLFPSMVLLSWGGNQLRMSGMQFGDLFPRYRSTTITVLSGVYAASASLFLVFSIMENVGVSRAHVSFFIGGFALCSALLSVLMPFHHIPYETHTDCEKKTVGESAAARRETLPLMTSALTVSSLLHQYWFFICLFTINLFQQNYNVWITASSCSEEEIELYSVWFSYSNLLSVFSAPIGGLFTDYIIKKAKRKASNAETMIVKQTQASFFPLLVSTFLSIGMYSCILFFNSKAILISLICMIVVRPCVVALSTAYLRYRFPGAHFNRLLGIYSTLASVLMMFQYPHFEWSQTNYYLTQGITLGLLVLSLSNPLHLLFTSYLKRSFQLTSYSVQESEKL